MINNGPRRAAADGKWAGAPAASVSNRPHTSRSDKANADIARTPTAPVAWPDLLAPEFVRRVKR